MALGEYDEALDQMSGDCRQLDHWFATEAFLEAWAALANFPDAFIPAERGTLISGISDKERVAAHIEAHWCIWSQDEDNFAEKPAPTTWNGCTQDMAQELLPPLLPLCVRWLSALARQGGLVE